jgi:hypothetical protein
MARDTSLRREVLSVFLSVVTRWLRRVTGSPTGRTGSVTVAQRFGSALNLNVHFHALVLDGVYTWDAADGRPVFRRARSPRTSEVAALVEEVARRVRAVLERRGLADDDEEADPDDGLALLQGAAVQGRSAVRGGQATRRRRGAQPRDVELPKRCAQFEWYNLHANVAVPARDRGGLERLCRYLMRPAIPEGRLRQREDGRLELALRRSFADGTTAVVFEPEELVERLLALVPPPRANEVHYHGVLAPAAAWRSQVVPEAPAESELAARRTLSCRPRSSRADRWAWADLLRHVFRVDATACPTCGGVLSVIEVVGEPWSASVIRARLLRPSTMPRLFPARAGPSRGA